MAERPTFVIAGGGFAGAKAAETLRAEGFDGRVVLVGGEPELPYERPPLSKSYLAGDSTLADARVHDEAWYAEHDVELLAGVTATELDPSARRLRTGDGGEVGYDKLLLATGAVPRRPPIPGADDPRVLALRTVADADVLRAAIGRGGRLGVVGAGWIGCEVAATARGHGADVTLVEYAETPLHGVLGAELGAWVASLHRSHGVELLTRTRVAAIEDGTRIRLEGGRAIECTAILVAVGVAPATALAETARLAVDDGVVADARLRTEAPDVHVAGDVASAHHPRYGRRLRVEHWAWAADQGAAAARSMLGRGGEFTTVPYFFSDQYDVGLEYVGLHGREDRVVLRGAPGSGRFQAWWIAADGHVTAAMHVNDWDAIEPMREAVERGARLSAAGLADADVPLEALAESAP